MSIKSTTRGKKILQAGALGFSLFFHIALLFFIGGAVLIEGVIPKPTFTEYMPLGETINDVTTTTEEEPPQESTEELNSKEPVLEQSVAPVPDAGASLNVIMMGSPNEAPAFVMPSASLNTSVGEVLDAQASGLGTTSNSIPTNNATNAAIRSMTSLFGSKGVVSDALVGYLYDLKQKADKTPSDMTRLANEVLDGMNKPNMKYGEVLTKFISTGWNPKILNVYYKSTDALSTYQIFIPAMQAEEAPKAFNVQNEVKPLRIAVHYKGNFISPAKGKFRFVGKGDDILAVRFNGKTVLDAGLYRLDPTLTQEDAGIVSVGPPNSRLVAGEWFNLDQDKKYPIEVLIGELPGEVFYMFLLIEEKGKEYESRKNNNGPLLPVFQVTPTDLPKFKPEENNTGGGPAIAKIPFSGKSSEMPEPAAP